MARINPVTPVRRQQGPREPSGLEKILQAVQVAGNIANVVGGFQERAQKAEQFEQEKPIRDLQKQKLGGEVRSIERAEQGVSLMHEIGPRGFTPVAAGTEGSSPLKVLVDGKIKEIPVLPTAQLKRQQELRDERDKELRKEKDRVDRLLKQSTTKAFEPDPTAQGEPNPDVTKKLISEAAAIKEVRQDIQDMRDIFGKSSFEALPSQAKARLNQIYAGIFNKLRIITNSGAALNEEEVNLLRKTVPNPSIENPLTAAASAAGGAFSEGAFLGALEQFDAQMMGKVRSLANANNLKLRDDFFTPKANRFNTASEDPLKGVNEKAIDNNTIFKGLEGLGYKVER